MAELLGRADAHEELVDGHRWSFEATDDVLAMILRMVEAERRCCRFLRFHIIVEPDGGPVSVELTGPQGTREFLTALVESWPQMWSPSLWPGSWKSQAPWI